MHSSLMMCIRNTSEGLSASSAGIHNVMYYQYKNIYSNNVRKKLKNYCWKKAQTPVFQYRKEHRNRGVVCFPLMGWIIFTRRNSLVTQGIFFCLLSLSDSFCYLAVFGVYSGKEKFISLHWQANSPHLEMGYQ